ncbi:hypothetical protein ACFOMD_10400 [Sphingoaurantiacus capsulatus]|uniref:Metalloprotease n=1 Tax=Sphingoaurantiacus capsulatus TaxID=1771310 RepID=A0ABV7XA28_9SPHN
MSASASRLLLALASTILVGAAATAIASPAAAAPVAVPKISFLYPAPHGTIFDRVCKAWIKQDTNPADVTELLARKAEFEAAWATTGREYMRLALAAAGRPFPYSEMQATLSVCAPDSMAFPLIIRMNDFLASNREYYVHDFALLAFHEVMHHYAQAIEAKSAIFAKYAAEPFSIRAHIHVVAFERYVLERTGRTEQLAKLRDYYTGRDVDHYRRAWEIVDKETVAAVVADAGIQP